MRIQVYKSEYNNKYEYNLIHACKTTFNYKGMSFTTEQEAFNHARKFIELTKKNIGECKGCWKAL